MLQLVTPGGSGGTAFTVDHEGAQYLVTAEHVVEAQPLRVEMTLYGVGGKTQLKLQRLAGVTGGADIAVFRLDVPITPQLEVGANLDGSVYTQDMYFLGYPYGLGLRHGNLLLLPFVKKAILSASTETTDGGHLLYLDGFNNPGFSGGPVAFYTQGSNEPRIGGVVSAYRADERRVRIGGEEIDATVLENTGIVLANNIKHAMDAIGAQA